MVKISKKQQMLIKNNWLTGKSMEEISFKLNLKKNFVKYYIKKKPNCKVRKSKIRMKILKNAYFYCIKKNKSGLRDISKIYSDLFKIRMLKKKIYKQIDEYRFVKRKNKRKIINCLISLPTCSKYLRKLGLWKEGYNYNILISLNKIFDTTKNDEKKYELTKECFESVYGKTNKKSIILNQIQTFKLFKKNRSKLEYDNVLLLPTIDETSQNFKVKLCEILTKCKLKFTDNFVYDKKCSQAYNDSLIDFDVKTLSEKNIETYNKFNELTKNGLYGNFEIIVKKNAYFVKPLTPIKKNTIICECLGDVCFKSDSKNKIILLKSPINDASLFLTFKQHGNLGAIISISGKSEQGNVEILRVSVNGLNRILFIAKKNIENEFLSLNIIN